MQYGHVGRWGLKLPEISLGLWHNFGGTAPLEWSRAIVRRAFELGITHLDLANNYGPQYGSTEEKFGQILRKDLAGHRDEIVVSTWTHFVHICGTGNAARRPLRDVGWQPQGGPGDASVPVDEDSSRRVGQRQRFRLREDRIARRAREALPGVDRHPFLGPSPRADNLPGHEQGTRPHARCPQLASPVGVRHQERTILARDAQGVGIAAR
jgi:hypothetical protein